MATRKRRLRSPREVFQRIWRDDEKLFYAITIIFCTTVISMTVTTYVWRQMAIRSDERLLADLQAYKADMDAQTDRLLEDRAMGPEMIGYHEAWGSTWAVYHRPRTAAACPAEPLAFNRGCVEEVNRMNSAGARSQAGAVTPSK